MSKKLTKLKNESNQLTVFVRKLGLEKDLQVYLYGELPYITIESLLDLLSVDISTFIKSASSPRDYIKINDKNSKIVIASKYGLIKILAQSNEEVSYKLTDYIFEIIHQIETKGSVKLEDVTSNKFLKELELYKSTDNYNDQLIKEKTKEIETLEQDLNLCNMEIKNLKEELKIANEELEENRELTSKLVKYIKIKKPELEIPVKYDEDIDTLNEKEIVDDAVDAVKIMKGVPDTKTQNIKTHDIKIISDNLLTFHLMRSIDFWYNDEGNKTYKWSIIPKIPICDVVIVNRSDNLTNNLVLSSPYLSYRDASEIIKLGRSNCVICKANNQSLDNYPSTFNDILYSDILISLENKNKLHNVITLLGRTEEYYIEELIKIIC